MKKILTASVLAFILCHQAYLCGSKRWQLRIKGSVYRWFFPIVSARRDADKRWSGGAGGDSDREDDDADDRRRRAEVRRSKSKEEKTPILQQQSNQHQCEGEPEGAAPIRTKGSNQPAKAASYGSLGG